MNNLTNLKKVLVMVIAIAVICLSTSVFAANDFTTLSGSLNNNSQPVATSETGGSNSSNNSGTNSNTSGTTNLSTTANNTANNTATNNSNATSLNSSSYNNTNLPETGLQDSLPIAVLIVVLGISAVYAYKKVKDYQNL